MLSRPAAGEYVNKLAVSWGKQRPAAPQLQAKHLSHRNRQPPKKDTLNSAVYGDTGTLDPVGISGTGGFLYIAPTYMEPLWDYRAGWKIEWLLATSVDDLGLNEMKIHLREGITFSNGNPLTAEDVLFTFKLWKATPNRALSVNGVDLDKTKVLDKYTLDVVFTDPTVDKMTQFSTLLVTDAESYDAKTASSKPIGTGAYVVKNYVVNSYVDLTARTDYWRSKSKNTQPAFQSYR